MRGLFVDGVATFATWFPVTAYKVFRVLEKALDSVGM